MNHLLHGNLGEAIRKLNPSYTEIVCQLLEELSLGLRAKRKKRELSPTRSSAH